MQGEAWELASGRKPCEASGVQGSAKLTQFVAGRSPLIRGRSPLVLRTALCRFLAPPCFVSLFVIMCCCKCQTKHYHYSYISAC